MRRSYDCSLRTRGSGQRRRSGPVTSASERVLLVIACLAFIGVLVMVYHRGERQRSSFQASQSIQAAARSDKVAPAEEPTIAEMQPELRKANERSVDQVGEFTICHTGGGRNCVVDGDTVWIEGIKIRIADIDAPETHPPRCDEEARLGSRATERLAELMNLGPFDQMVQGRAKDRYGRQLRVLMRDGTSLGEQLVAEGLARRWEGARQPWC